MKELNRRSFLQPAAGLLLWPAATLALRSSKRLRGFYSFEWHPEIEEPEVAIPHFANVMSEYLTQAGFKE